MVQFNTGKVVSTRGIYEMSTNDNCFYLEVVDCFKKYQSNDWGKLSDDDKQMNDDAVKYGNDRILAKYETSKGNIYIITEYDRSFTTIMFCDEY